MSSQADKIELALNQLESDNVTVRREGAHKIRAVARRSPKGLRSHVEVLAASLQDQDPKVRERVAAALSEIAEDSPNPLASDRIIRDLTLGLSANDPLVRRYTLMVFRDLAEFDVGKIVDHVRNVAELGDSEDPVTQLFVAAFLVEVAKSRPETVYEVRDLLVRVVETGDEDSETVALCALGYVGQEFPEIGEEMEAHFHSAVQQGDEEKRTVVGDTLAFILSQRPDLIDRYLIDIETLLNDDSSRVKESGIAVLQRCLSGTGELPETTKQLKQVARDAAQSLGWSDRQIASFVDELEGVSGHA